MATTVAVSTRANIEMVHQLDKSPNYPAVKFTTASDFFSKLSHEMGGRPTHKGEMQFIVEGCYTTVSEIKSGNRNCENALFGSEFFNTLRWMNGDKYPQLSHQTGNHSEPKALKSMILSAFLF